MAIRSTNVNDYLKRTTNVVAASSNYTCVFWWRWTGTTTPDSYRSPFVTLDDPAVYNAGAAVYNYNTYVAHGGITGLRAEGFNLPTEGDSPLSVPTVNLWYPIAYVRTGNTHSFYLAGVLIGSGTANISAATFGWVSLLSDTFDTGSEAMEICRFREWNTALNLSQINAEFNSPTAVHLTNLVTDTPLTSDLLDISGNGNNWTAVGSPSFVSDPAFPTNISLATATDIGSTPASVSQDVGLDSFAFTVWYKYTSVMTDTVISTFVSNGVNTSAGSYQPFAGILNASGENLYGSASIAVVTLIPVNNPGNTFYIKISPITPFLLPNHIATLLVETLGISAIPTGTPIIIGDTFDDTPAEVPAGATFLDINNDNTVLGYFANFPAASEHGTTLPDGTMAVGTDDQGTNFNNVLILDTNYNILHTVNLGTTCRYLTSDNNNLFYVLYATGNWHVKSLTPGGLLGTTDYNLGAVTVRGIAVDPTNSILYYQLFNSTTVKRWDLINNIAMSDLVSGLAHGPTFDLLCSTDGSVISGDPTTNSVIRYDAAGAILNTYTPVADISGDARMCLGIDYTTFWLWTLGTLNHNPGTLVNVRNSDGIILVNKSYVTFLNGISNEPKTLTPTSMFGPEDSCPMLITRSSTPIGTIVVGKASNPLATGVVFTVNGPSGLFTIMTDTSPGQVITVSPGTYSIVEVADSTYQPEYFVSNDPVNNDNLNVVVADGELVDVVIVNSLKTKFGGLYQLVNRTNDQLINQDGSLLLVKINWFFDLFIGRDK